MASEQRRAYREDTVDREVRARVHLPEGRITEGLIADVSRGGARIAGPASGLIAGDEIPIVLLFLTGEQVRYRCEVRHVDRDGAFFGVKFMSPPERILETPQQHRQHTGR